MLHAAFLMPLFPLAGFLVLLLVGRRVGDPVAGLDRHGGDRRLVRGGLLTLVGLHDVSAAGGT